MVTLNHMVGVFHRHCMVHHHATREAAQQDYVDTELGIEQTIQIAASSFRTFDIIPICGCKKCMLKKDT